MAAKISLSNKVNWGLIIPTLLAITGWFISAKIESNRDRTNKLRDIKINYLIDAYTKLSNASLRDINNAQYHRDIESAIADIQLFGSPEQIEILGKQMDNAKISSDFSALPLQDIILELRNTLRYELRLPPTDESYRFFRFYEMGNDSVAHDVKRLIDTLNTLGK